MGLQGFDNWLLVIAHVRLGRTTYYHAPMDHKAVRARCKVLTPNTVRVFPLSADADPFTADVAHLDRFRREVQSNG